MTKVKENDLLKLVERCSSFLAELETMGIISTQDDEQALSLHARVLSLVEAAHEANIVNSDIMMRSGSWVGREALVNQQGYLYSPLEGFHFEISDIRTHFRDAVLHIKNHARTIRQAHYQPSMTQGKRFTQPYGQTEWQFPKLEV